MKVHDLRCWPPKWRAAPGLPGHAANGERGVLIATRWDLRAHSLTLTMEHEGDRYSGVLEGEVKMLTKLYLLLGWHIGQPLAKLGSLEMPPDRRAG